MNILFVGDNTKIVKHLPSSYLLIDDGKLIDQIDFPRRRRITHFDVTKHHFNPLKDIDYLRKCEFVDIIDALFPAGANTLTKDTGLTYILKALDTNPKTLDRLIPLPDRKSTPGHIWAYDKIDRILFSPFLRPVLTKAKDFPFKGIVLARLDRAKLGDFDCKVLANFLISNYKGAVVIPDFGFYGAKHHLALITQNRLIAGVNFLDETNLRSSLLLISEKRAAHCTADDAETLAGYSGLSPHSNVYNEFIQRSIE